MALGSSAMASLTAAIGAVMRVIDFAK